MSPEEANIRLRQIRGRLSPLTERLMDIEARMAAVRNVGQPPGQISLREFTSMLLDRKKQDTAHKNERGALDRQFAASLLAYVG